MGKLTYTTEDFQKAAITFRKDLLRLPLLALNEILKYVTLRPGVRYKEMVGTSSVNAQFAPYRPGERQDANLNLVLRELETFFGSVNADFEPNAEIATILGHKASQALGDGQKSTLQAHEVLANIAKSLGYNLNAVLFNAKRNPAGKTSADLFNGWDTITADEITAGNIADEKKNLVTLDTKIDKNNACDILKEVIYNMDVNLRNEDCFLYCPYEVADAYNENYLLTHSGIVYNDKYGQVTVEGSNNRLTIVPLSSKAGSQFLHISPKRNMLIGCDQLSDIERIDIKEFAPDILTYMAKMFFGVQFESIDPRRLLVVKLADNP